MTLKSMNTPEECNEFQQQLPEYFESGADTIAHAHLRTCENCSSLVRDLQYIAAQAKLLLPIHDPSPAVWENISHALSKKADAK
ncbi:MAG: anti-sigma factor [Acidobacteriaceae bacterium]